MDLKKLVVPPSSNQKGTSRVSEATTITMSRNAPSTLVNLSSAASRTRKDYTSSARPERFLHSSKGDQTGLLPPPDA
jgi:hypothetical protein